MLPVLSAAGLVIRWDSYYSMDEETIFNEFAGDEGGAVYPSQSCGHVFQAVDDNALHFLDNVIINDCEWKERTCSECSSCENWICLKCGNIGCSRYYSRHSEAHFMATFCNGSSDSHCLSLKALKFKHADNNTLLTNIQRSFHVGIALPRASMDRHMHPEKNCLERPVRTNVCVEYLQSTSLLARLRTIDVSDDFPVDEELRLVHCSEYIDKVLGTAGQSSSSALLREELAAAGDVFLTTHTAQAATDAVRAVVTLTSAILEGQIGIRSAFALTRPPGHHADRNSAGGYCLFNNVAVAAMRALHKYSLSRVLILDWDIHHGNGCQDIFYSDPRVLHISIHKQIYRADSGEMALCGDAGVASNIGSGPGLGFNVNIPLSEGPVGIGLGDNDYAAIFARVVIPLIQEYAPEMVFVAAGFDAGVADRTLTVGGYSLTPNAFACMTTSLLHYASPIIVSRGGSETKLLACLEGGYDPLGLAKSVEAVLQSLLDDCHCDHNDDGIFSEGSRSCSNRLGDMMEWLATGESCDESVERVIDDVRARLAEHWSCFRDTSNA